MPDADPDATRIMRPRPGGRRPEAPPPAEVAPVPDAPSPFRDGSLLPFAMPLLQLLGLLRTLAGEADPVSLRERTAEALRLFEQRALAAGIAPEMVRRGQYALCDSLDAAVLNTPWGASSSWARQTLVATFHPAIGPNRFADALRHAEARAAKLGPVLELMVLCLSVGVPDEAARRQATAALLTQTPQAAELSPHWQGVAAPFQKRVRPRLPVWVVGVAALVAAAGLFVWLRAGVDAAGDSLFTAMIDAPPAHMPQIARDPAPPLPPLPPAATPTPQDRVRSRLAAEDGVTVAGSPGTPMLRLPDKALFAGASATLLPGALPLLQRVAAALQPEGGTLRVIGYADDRPVRTVAFASSFKLTAARAEAVRAALAPSLPGVGIAAEGRGGADPVAPNSNEPGREQNRRVDIVLDGASP